MRRDEVSTRAEVLKNEGNARRAAGDREGAERCYRRALKECPGYSAALYNLGLTLRELARYEEAEACFRDVLAHDPHDTEAGAHLAALLIRRRQFDEADAILRRALERAPHDALLWLLRGELGLEIFSAESLRVAADAFERAAGLQPGLAAAHYGLGCVHAHEGRHAQALASYRGALRIDPGDVPSLSGALTEALRLCEWSGLDESIQALRKAVGARAEQPVHPFDLLSICDSPAEQLACARRYAGVLEKEAARGRLVLPHKREKRARLRLGYLSADFHAHATAFLAAELFELHDRDRFEVIAYSYGPDEASPMRARLQAAFDRFVDLRGTSDAAAARAIHADGIDILVDLKGYTFRARPGILALRPAPIQVSYLGYPGTSGARFVDYLIGDRVVTPASEADHFSEALVLMPGSYQVNDRKREIASLPDRRDVGLPLTGFVFCCFNHSYKIRPEMFSAWMRLLHAVPGSVLWLLESNTGMARNLRREALGRGVDPTRLIFAPLVPLADHLARMRLADLFLDTFPVCGHTAASDAMWSGLPLVTVAGRSFASRVAASVLAAAGVPELVTRSLAEYESLAATLARQPKALAALRERLNCARSGCALFDTPRFVRDIETAFARMWQMYTQAGEKRRIEV